MRTHAKIYTLLWVMFFEFISFPAVATEPLSLTKFYGEWQSDGDAFGQQAKSTMIWKTAMDGKFTQLDYKIQLLHGDEDRFSVFAGVAYYKRLDYDSFKGFWADNSGDLHPITAKFAGSTLLSVWGDEDTKLGQTEYELISDSTINVTDWIRTANGWKQFNENIFHRIAEH